MSKSSIEIDQKLAAAQEQLDKILKSRAVAERAVNEAERAWRAQQEALQAILSEEGELRGSIGQLQRLLSALDTTNE